MDLMTKVEINEMKHIAEFYDTLAADYDEMTGFQKRFIQERPFFHLLVERFKIRTALDAGSGTGFHALLLAQLGVKVAAIDVSTAMLQHVKRHADELGLPVDVIESSFQNLNEQVRTTFDAIFCLGNGLAHLLSKEGLGQSLHNFASLLKPGGVLIVQNLNYDRILLQHERIQSVKESGDKTFVRFYDYHDESLSFNILTLLRKHGAIMPTLETVPLKPWTYQELQTALANVGFNDVRAFGGITLAEFDRASSKDLVIIARKDDANG